MRALGSRSDHQAAGRTDGSGHATEGAPGSGRSTAFSLPWRFAAAIALLAAVQALPGSDLGLARPVRAGECNDGWRRSSVQGAHASLLTDVASVDGRPAWLVGMHAGQGIPRRPWIMRWTPDGWRTSPADRSGSDSGLMAVDPSSTSEAWAVGFRADGRLLRPVSQHYRGGGWATRSVPQPGHGSATLTDVSTIDGRAAWAVGYRTTSRGARPFAVTLRDGRWAQRDPTLARRTFGALLSVTAIGRDDVWAAGWMSDGGSVRPLITHWDGARWQRAGGAPLPAGEAVITELAATGRRDVMAVGYLRDRGGYRALLERWDGSTWSTVDAPVDGARSLIPESVDIGQGGRPIIAGASRDRGARGFVGFVSWPTADGWQTTATPGGTRAPSNLRSVISDHGRVITAGWSRKAAAAVESCGTGTPTVATPESATSPVGDVASGLDAAAPDARPLSALTDRTSPASAAGRRRAPSATRVHFRDVAADVGLTERTVTYGATALDFDGDGWQDLIIGRHTDRARLLRNRHGRFVAAAAGPLPAHDRHGCVAADIDRDGDDEAFCAIGAARGAKLKTNELWLDLDGNARDVAATFGVDDPFGRGRRATFLDLDGDPFPDLFVTSDPVRVDGLPSVDRLFRNDGGAGFVSASEMGLDLPIGGECARSADLDRDGRSEVLVCTGEAWGDRRGLHVFAARAGRFRDVTADLDLQPGSDVDALAVDLDGDRRPDIVQLSGSRALVSLQREGRYITVESHSVSDGKALASGDADGDGDQDLFIVQAGQDLLLLNDGSGREYRTVRIADVGGSPEAVVAIDHDRNGLDDFLVLNGDGSAGPIQLIAGFRASSR